MTMASCWCGEPLLADGRCSWDEARWQAIMPDLARAVERALGRDPLMGKAYEQGTAFEKPATPEIRR